MKPYTVESILAVLAGLCVAGCKNEQPKAEPQSAAVPANSAPAEQPAAATDTVAAKEVPPAAGSGTPAPAGSTKKGEKKCAPGGCAPGKCG